MGVNYTAFSSEDTRGALSGSRLALGNSWGMTVHGGIDIRVGTGQLRLDVRWVDIEATVRLDGDKLGASAIDPLVHGPAYVMKLRALLG
ncbi:OmpW family outer membrane protein [Luteimonas deserti]|uniref:Uncharacterized protein n=1 Tax=Luteimonas deserti TaxID=2752306 RepID=A0A7Z0QPG1_9GAMM|nr:OmpW family outer membrane protein [Luteimonas deserti]NYZ62424.1 hypothetical protein [Luteimonas deserti]